VVGQDHLLDSALALMASLRLLEVGEKHVLRTAQANALRAELDGFARVLRSVNVRTDAQAPRFICPLHESFVGLWKLRNNQGHRFGVDHSFAAIERDPIPFLDRKSTRLNSSHGSISYAV